jgi:hypothetical protein
LTYGFREGGGTVLPTRVLYYGTDAALPERVPLRAGPLSLVYEAGDLRTVKWGEHEVLRRVYVAVRDRNWGTIAPIITNIVMDVQHDHFTITFDVANQEGDINFAWQGTINGSSEGVLTYTMNGIARSTFLRNRIGFCVLHPAECAGAQCRIEHVVGEREQAALPVLIRPDQPLAPFAELATLAHEVTPGVWANLRFEGDIFEMEDQRNWTDASFKTFCTPLRLPYPVEIAAGTRVNQRITLQVVDEHGQGKTAAGGGEPQRLTFTIVEDQPPMPLPKLGLGAASHGQPLSPRAVERLAALKLDHLRVDLWLAQDNAAERLAAATAEAQALGANLHVALYITPEQKDEQLTRLLAALQAVQPPAARWLIYPAAERFLGGSRTAEVLAAAHHSLDGVIGGAQFAAGTDTDFIFVQRTPPPLDQIDLLTFSINPQVHAFDNASLVETLGTQATAVQSAHALAGGKPVMVSPVTLKMRYNAYATAPPAPTPPGQLPANVDVRQMSLFAAGWTLGSIAALTAAGAESATYYETTGWRGVLETDEGSSVPDKFRSLPGGLFPLYYVLAGLADFARGQALAAHSSDPLAVVGLALAKDGQRRVLLANVTPEPQRVEVAGLSGSVQIRYLDERNAEAAMLDSAAFELSASEVQAESSGRLSLELLPYAIAQLDA